MRLEIGGKFRCSPDAPQIEGSWMQKKKQNFRISEKYFQSISHEKAQKNASQKMTFEIDRVLAGAKKKVHPLFKIIFKHSLHSSYFFAPNKQMMPAAAGSSLPGRVQSEKL